MNARNDLSILQYAVRIRASKTANNIQFVGKQLNPT
jgi:hypothetical protein